MRTWEEVIAFVPTLDVHEKITIEKSSLPPMPKEFRWRIGYTSSEYSMTLEDGRSIHVKVLPKRYVVEWDHADPNTNLIEHFKKDLSLWEQIAIGAAVLLGADHVANKGKIRKRIVGR